LNDFQIMTLLISNLSPSAAMYVREWMFRAGFLVPADQDDDLSANVGAGHRVGLGA
jgi:hypothetical protein